MIATLSGITGTLEGCIARRGVPTESFTVSAADAREDMSRMRGEPVELERPVVVLAGYRAFPTLVSQVVWRLYPITSGDQDDYLPIAYTFQTDIEAIAAMVTERVEATWPSDDPSRTVEVDVIGVSMGGLVARTAALPVGGLPSGHETRSKQLRIGTLYSMGSPHGGAKLAERIAPDKAARDMIPGSPFLTALDAAFEDRDYGVVPYAVLNDTWVGATNAAPPEHLPVWTPGTHAFSHFMITRDMRIMADVARRLRGEAPLGLPAAVPSD